MKSRIEFLRHAMQLMYDWAIFSLVILFGEICIATEKPSYWFVAVLFFLLVASYLIRKFSAKYLYMFFLHLVLVVVVLLLPFTMACRAMLVLEVLFLLENSYSYGYRKGTLKSMEDAPWPSFVICFLIYFVGGVYSHSATLTIASYLVGIIMLILYLVMIYLEGLQDYLRSTRDVSGVPIKNIIGTNTIMVGAILSCLGLALILGRIFDFGSIFKILGSGIIAVLKLFAMVLSTWFGFVAALLKSGGANPAPPTGMGDVETVGQLHRVGQALEVLLELAVAVAGVFILYKLGERYIKRLLVKRNFADDTIEVAESIKEKKQERVVKTFFHSLRLSPEEKARKLYKQRIERHKYDIRLLQDKTCREIREELKMKDLDDVSIITECYEDIRYGGRTADKEMLRKMR